MNCNELQEHISAAVDNEIEDGLKPGLQQHFKDCPKCRNEFELEKITKLLIKRKVPRTKAPPELARRISEQLQRESSISQGQNARWMNFSFLPTWKTAIAISGALAIILLVILIPSGSHHSHANPIDGNIIHQTYNNFDGVLDGKIKPQVASANPSVVQAFLSSKTNFDVNVPRLNHCLLVGGVFSQYQKEGLAHLIYKHGNDMIYMYQAKFQAVMESHTLDLSDDAKRDLKNTGWYFENLAPDCSLVIWVVDSTVCCAIADISRNDLMACLTGAE